MKKVVDDAEVLAALDAGLDEGRAKRASGEQRRKIVRGSVSDVLAAAPTLDALPLPPIVGLAEAAQILGTKKPYITRLMNDKKLVPAARPASGPIFKRSHVEQLKRERDRVRAARDEAKESES